MKKRVIILSVVSALFVGIVIGYVLIPKLWSEPIVIAEDSFFLRNPHNLSQDEQRELEELTEEIDKNPYWYRTTGLPFNRYGYYVNSIFLQDGEVINVVIRSNIPLSYSHSLSSGNDILVVFESDSGIGVVPEGRIITDYVQLERVNGDWQLSFTYTAQTAEAHWIYIANTAPKDVWCEYVVLLRK